MVFFVKKLSETLILLLGFFRRRPLLWVLTLSCALRIGWLVFVRPVPVSDFEQYRALGEHLLIHGKLPPSAYRLPVLPCFLAALMTVSESIAWLSLGMIFVSTGLVAIIYVLVLRLTGGKKSVAVWASLACGLNPTFVFFGSILGSEYLFVLLLFSALLVLCDIERHPHFRASFAGLLLGLAALTRGEGVFYVPSCLLLCWPPAAKLWHKFVWSAIFLTACAVVVLPWYVRNSLVVGHGAGLSTTGGINFYFAHNADGYGYRRLDDTRLAGLGEVEAQHVGYALGLTHIRQQGITAICRNIMQSTRQLYKYSAYALYWSTKLPCGGDSISPTKYVPGVGLFSDIGHCYYCYATVLATLCVLFLRTPHRLSKWLPLLSVIALNWICYAVVFWSKARYRFTAEVVICIFAGISLHSIVSCAVDRNGRAS